MAIVCVVFLGPLVSLRNLKMLGPMSTVAVVVAGCLVSAVALLAGAAGFEGKLGDFNWLPNKDLLGDTVSEIVITLLSILPVITMSFVCHYNLLPVVRVFDVLNLGRCDMPTTHNAICRPIIWNDSQSVVYQWLLEGH